MSDVWFIYGVFVGVMCVIAIVHASSSDDPWETGPLLLMVILWPIIPIIFLWPSKEPKCRTT